MRKKSYRDIHENGNNYFKILFFTKQKEFNVFMVRYKEIIYRKGTMFVGNIG